jgi:cell division septum initiation protein DivIVA
MTTGNEDPPGDAVPLREIFGEGGIPTDVMPNFAVVIRGYERGQVDGYVAELLTALEETRANLEEAHTRLGTLTDHADELNATVTRHQALPAFADLGDHISTMMATAAEESETMRRRAETQALDILNRAQEQSHAMLRAADERATDVRAKADRLQAETLAAKQRTLDEATREAAALVADGERRRRETLTAAEALLAAATEEVTRIRATRDLGADAMEELSAVLARVAADTRKAWRAQDGVAEPTVAESDEAEAPPDGSLSSDDVPARADDGTTVADEPEWADDPARPAAEDQVDVTDAEAPGDATEPLIDLETGPDAEEAPSPTRRVR